MRWGLLEQRGDGLGDRLAGVLGDLFAAGADCVLAVDSDSPPIPLEYLAGASRWRRPAGWSWGRPPTAATTSSVATMQTWERHGCSLAKLLRTSADELSRACSRTRCVKRMPSAWSRSSCRLWIDVDGADQLAVLTRLRGEAASRGEPLSTLREVYLHVTHRCGRACRHCYDKNAARRRPRAEAPPDWKDAVDQCGALGASSFVFIGGDPLSARRPRRSDRSRHRHARRQGEGLLQ